jgi:hypothetical protein
MDEEQDQEQEIGARSVRVFETVVLHATDVIYWLDGTTADDENKMLRIDRPLHVDFTERPRDVKTLSNAGRTAFWRDAHGSIVNGVATEQQRTRPAIAPFTAAGVVRDVRGTYNPRVFSVSLGSGDGHAVPLYRSPAGTRFPSAGGLLGTLRLADTNSPVPWALLELSVELSATDTMIFRAQANQNGDFALTLNRLPPLPESVEAYSAQLSVSADLTAEAGTPVNVDSLEAALLGALDAADSFLEQIDLDIHPGDVQRVNSFNRTFLAVQATD